MDEPDFSGGTSASGDHEDQRRYLTHLPPHMAEDMLKRIDRIRRYLAEPTRQNANDFAAELKMGVGHFKMLARAFSIHKRADKLPGSHWPKKWPKRSPEESKAEEQAIIKEANDMLPDAAIEDVVRLAKTMATQRGTKIPSPTTLRGRVHELRASQVTNALFGHDCHIVIAHAALNIPVDAGGQATMPVAALAIAPALKQVIGLGLSFEGPDIEATTLAIFQALEHLPLTATDAVASGTIRIAMECPDSKEWKSLLQTLENAGATCIHRKASLHNNLTTAYLGRRHSHIEIKPRKMLQPTSQRDPQLIRGQYPMNLDDAQDFATKTMLANISPSARGPIADRLRSALVEYLERI